MTGKSIIVTCDGYEIWTKEFDNEEDAANVLCRRYAAAIEDSCEAYRIASSFSEEERLPGNLLSTFCHAVYFKDGDIRDCIAIDKYQLFNGGSATLFIYDDEFGLEFKNFKTLDEAREKMKSDYEINADNMDGDVYFASYGNYAASVYSEDFSFTSRIICQQEEEGKAA